MTQVSSLPSQRAELFATCEGRMAALARHYWDVQHEDAKETSGFQAQFADLLQAVLPDAKRHGITVEQTAQWQIDGLNEISELILTIRHGLTLENSSTANQAFVQKLQICATLLLPPEN